MAAMTVQTLAEAGTSLTFTAVNSPDTFVNDGRTMLRVKNASGGNITVTIAKVTNCNQGFSHDRVATVVAATGDVTMGPFTIQRFSATCTVTYSATASVTSAAWNI